MIGALDAHPKTHDGEEIDYMAVEKHEEPTGEKPQEAGVEVGIEAKDEAAGEKSKVREKPIPCAVPE
jgi:hypothetical protein